LLQDTDQTADNEEHEAFADMGGLETATKTITHTH
jgi:hypothetical protein